MRRALSGLAILGFLISFGPANAATLADALRAMADGDTGQALSILDDLIGPRQPDSDQARLLEARALFLAGKIEQAAKAYQKVLESAPPGSEAVHLARFGLAECLARQGRFSRAEKLFSESLDALASDARRTEIARRFVRLGDENLDPIEGQGQAAPGRAERFYRAALDMGLAGELAEQIRVKVGRCLVRQKRHHDAATWFIEYLKDEKYEKSPHRVEVTLLAAQSLIKAGRQREARRYLRDLLADHPNTKWAAEAAYLTSRTHGIPTPADGTSLARGRAALRRFIEKYPKHEKVFEARLELALAPLHLGRHAEAEDELRELIAAGGPADVLATARYKLGLCLASQGRHQDAAAAFRDYLDTHPAHEFWSQARTGVEDMLFQRAQAASSDKRFAEAARLFEGFAEKHAASARAPEALFRAAEAHVEAKKPAAALRVLSTLTGKFAAHLFGFRGWLLTGKVHEELRSEFAKAREAYEKAKKAGSPVAAEASSRLMLLERPSLLVQSPQNFRKAEKPHITWYVRNIENVTVRAFRIQAEDFFRDRLDMNRVTAVDIALCEPDRTWTVPVESYRKFARIEQKVPLPFDRPGLYLLNLSAGDLEATTAVLVSDLGLIVKTGSGEVFVFAQDLARQRSEGGVRVLVSDGKKLLVEGETGTDGIFRAELPEDLGPEQLVVFADRGDHLAWTGQDDPDVGAPVQLSPRAFVFSDRPVYRPGDEVHLSGIFRGVRDGRYTFAKGEQLELVVTDAAGATIFSAKTALDEYGVFHRALRLDPAAREGSYRFSVKQKDGPSFPGSFQVREFRRLPFELLILLDRPVFFRGEEITGMIEVRHPQGTPAADLQVHYQLAGDAGFRTGRTDANGQVRFEFSTRAFEETQEIKILAHLARSHQKAEASALLAVAAFNLGLEVDDRTLFAGQPFQVAVRVTGPAGEPRAASVELQAMRRDERGGGEVRVWSQRATVPDSGKLSVECTLDRPGAHVLRALAFDRAGHPVVAELAISLVGDEEPGIWLDVAGDEQTLGKPARVTVHSRLDRALVLLTAETDHVLDHRALVVTKGENHIELAMTAQMAPNFLLAAAAMHGDDLHLASRSVRVSQEIEVKVRSDKDTYQPGEEVTLTILAADIDGKPVDARLLISVVDETLLAAFPENLPDLLGFFHIPRPEGEVLTCASNTFRFEQVEGQEVEKAEVREAQGSAAMAALKSRRKVMTDRAISEFDKLAKREAEGFGGLGLSGTGRGGGGMGARGYGRAASIRTGRASVLGGKDHRWRTSFAETAVFFHDVRTGPDGVASAVFRLPDSITRWRVTCRGVTRKTLLGEVRKEIRVTRRFWARLMLPPVLEAGDRVAPLVRVFNHTKKDLQASVELEHAGKKHIARIRVPARRTADHLFEPVAVPSGRAGYELVFALTATADDMSDRLRLGVPVRPRGVRIDTVAEGVLSGRVARELVLARGLNDLQLRIRLSNRLARFFIGDRLDPLLFGDRPEEALVAIELIELLGPDSSPAMRDLVSARLRRALTHLRAVQRADGGWGWSRGARSSSLEMTAAAIQALARSRAHAGELAWPFPQAELDRAATWLSAQMAGLPPDDFARRTEVIHALAHLGRERIPSVALHRLHRLRRELDPGSAALLGLTWIRLGRPEQAAEVVDVINRKISFDDRAIPFVERWRPAGRLSDLDRVRALQLMAEVRPADPAVERGKRWLLGRGRILGWRHPRESAAALRTLGRLLAVESRDARARIQVRINGKPAGTIDLSGETAHEVLQVDPTLLKPGKNEVVLSLTGSGSCLYSAVLSGHLADAPALDDEAPVKIARHLEPVPTPYKGTPISSGFSVVTHKTRPWFNDVERLPAGAGLKVTLEVERDFDRPLDHCVLLERIPPGFELEEGSASGGHTHLLRDGRRLAFYLASAGRKMRISYRLVAVNPGIFRFAPPRLVSLAYPDTSLLGPATGFEVSSPKSPPPEVRPTPLELYQRGMAAAREEDHALTIESLEALWEGYELRPGHVNEVLDKLLFASIGRDDHQRILKYFELAKEKNPSLVIPFDRIAPVQEAYRRLEAHEGGLLLARGLAEAQFTRQLRAVGLLTTLDEMAEAMDLLRRLLAAWPHNHLTARAAYAFSQVLYGRADRISDGEKLEGFDRPGLLDEVAAFMAGFLGRHPDDPEAPTAVFSLASALIERDRPAEAIEWCAVGLRRHEKSDMAPALAYLKAFAHFRRGEYGPSLDLCRQVADTAQNEEHVDMARYIMAQIHHARGRIDEAIVHYRKVAERFRDAGETIRELEKSWFSVPEVIRAPASKRPQLEVTARKIKKLHLRAYKVDLMKLYLLKRSLRNLADVNLAGIKPILTREYRLRPTRTSGPFDQTLSLSLPGKGAYLVLLRGGATKAHSLVLVGSLDLEVTEIQDEGRVRVAVRDSRGRTIPNARVQLKGDDDERFTAGKTDLRGIFIGDEVEGAVTVIAKHKGAYGLYRGSVPLSGEVEEEDRAGMKRLKRIDFDEGLIQGQIEAPAAQQAIDFFNQDVRGMSVQQAK